MRALIARVVEHVDARKARDDLLQQFHPFRVRCWRQAFHAGQVATRPCEALDEPGFERSVGAPDDDRDGAGRTFGSKGAPIGIRQDDVDVHAHQLGREFGKTLGVPFGKPALEGIVLAFDVAQLLQSLGM